MRNRERCCICVTSACLQNISTAKCSLCSVYRLLHSDRDVIPDVPAIYFVLPTEENIKRICQVCFAHENKIIEN